MHTVSISVASLAALPQPMKSSSGPARFQLPAEPPFKGQLHDAIQERNGGAAKDAKQSGAGEGDKPQTPKKKEALPPPVAVSVLQPTLPPPPAAGFGLPSAGIEAGPRTEPAAKKADAVEQPSKDTPSKDTPALETPVSPAMNPPAPPAIHPDQKTGLAFALRLVDLTPQRELHLSQAAQQQPPALEPDREPEPALALPAIALQTALAPPATSQPTAPASSIAVAIKGTQPAPQQAAAAMPVIAKTPPREGASPESGSHSGDGASGRQTPQQMQPAADLKSFRQASATSESVSSASRETPLQTPAPALTAAIPAAATTPAPAPPNSVMAAPPVERVSMPLAASNPASPVTDVSVNLQVPRADASGGDRVAIRMLQVGSEIHVSVRTPDNQLAQSLRQDLGKLTTGLDQGGFRIETWRPTAANAAAQSNTNPQHQPSQESPNRDSAGSGARSGGNSGQGSGEQKRKQQDERPRWVAELEQQRNQ